MRAVFGTLCVAALAASGMASASAVDELSTEAIMLDLGIDPVPYRGYSKFIEGTPAETLLQKLNTAVVHLDAVKAEKTEEEKKATKQCAALESALRKTLKPLVGKIMAVEHEKHAVMVKAHAAKERAASFPRRIEEAEDRRTEAGHTLEIHKAAEAAASAMRAATSPGVRSQAALVERSRDQLETVLASAANALDLLRQRVERAKAGLRMIKKMQAEKAAAKAEAKAGASLLEVAASKTPSDAELRAMVAKADAAVKAVEADVFARAKAQGASLALATEGMSPAKAHAVVAHAERSVNAAAKAVAEAEAMTGGRPGAAAAAAAVADAAAADTAAWRQAMVRLLAKLFEDVETLTETETEGSAVDAAEEAIREDAEKSHAAFAQAEKALVEIRAQAKTDRAFAQSLIEDHLQPLHDRACALRDEREEIVRGRAGEIDACHARAVRARDAAADAGHEAAKVEKRAKHILGRLEHIHRTLGFDEYDPSKHVVQPAGAATGPAATVTEYGSPSEALAKHAPLFNKLDAKIEAKDDTAEAPEDAKKEDKAAVKEVNAFFKTATKHAAAMRKASEGAPSTDAVSNDMVRDHATTEDKKESLESIVEQAVEEALEG